MAAADYSIGPDDTVDSALDKIALRESGNRNIPNMQGPFGTPLSTASGPYQMLDSTWQEGVRLAGLQDQPARAIMASPDDQRAAARAIYNKYGERPWASSAPGGNVRALMADSSAPASGGPDLNALVQQLLAQSQPPQVDQTPVNRSFTSLLGEALGGGDVGLGGMSPAAREAAGNRALLAFGSGMMSKSGWAPMRATMGEAISAGTQQALASEAGTQEAAYTALGQRQKLAMDQQQMRINALREAIPLLQYGWNREAAAGALAAARGGAAAPPAGPNAPGALAPKPPPAAAPPGGPPGAPPAPPAPTPPPTLPVPPVPPAVPPPVAAPGGPPVATPAAPTLPPVKAAGPAAPTEPAPAAPAPPVAAPPAEQPPTKAPPQYPDVKSGDTVISHPGSLADYMAAHRRPTPSTDIYSDVPPAALDQSYQSKLDIAQQMMATDPAGAMKAIQEAKASYEQAKTDWLKTAAEKRAAFDSAETTRVQSQYDAELKAYNEARQSQFGTGQDVLKSQATDQIARNKELMTPFLTDATRAQSMVARLDQARQLLPGLPEGSSLLSDEGTRAKLQHLAALGLLPEGWEQHLQGAELWNQVIQGMVGQMGQGASNPGARQSAYEQFGAAMPTLAQSSEGRETSLIMLQELVQRKIAEAEYLAKYQNDPKHFNARLGVPDMSSAISDMERDLGPMVRMPPPSYNPNTATRADDQRYLRYYNNVPTGGKYIGYDRDAEGKFHPSVKVRAQGETVPQSGEMD